MSERIILIDNTSEQEEENIAGLSIPVSTVSYINILIIPEEDNNGNVLLNRKELLKFFKDCAKDVTIAITGQKNQKEKDLI